MPKLTVSAHPEICPEGAVIKNVPLGASICSILREHEIGIEHACECCCACTTCHVIISQGYQTLEPPTDLEEDLLDQAWGVTATSRLSCQAKITNPDGDLTIEIPRYSRNHAKENHS